MDRLTLVWEASPRSASAHAGERPSEAATPPGSPSGSERPRAAAPTGHTARGRRSGAVWSTTWTGRAATSSRHAPASTTPAVPRRRGASASSYAPPPPRRPSSVHREDDLARRTPGLAERVGLGGLVQREDGVDLGVQAAGLDQGGDLLQPE